MGANAMGANAMGANAMGANRKAEPNPRILIIFVFYCIANIMFLITFSGYMCYNICSNQFIVVVVVIAVIAVIAVVVVMVV
jgi:predicted membrane-bound mannosyltransferase